MGQGKEGEIKAEHDREQLEAKFESLGCTLLPVGIVPTHKAFMEILKAVILSEKPLTQDQMADIIDANEGKRIE
jgi:hypothetical protein